MVDIEKINSLIKISKDVFNDCCLENGAIVAGNPGNPIYSKDSPNYFYVWPRDAAFICVAMDILGMHAYTDKFFQWCFDRGSDNKGLLWQHYVPNGLPSGFFISELYNNREIKKLNKYFHPGAFYLSKALRSQLQPDGNCLLLWALDNHIVYDKEAKLKYKDLATKLANGICSLWENGSFKYLIHDLWEEKIGYPGVNLTYDVVLSIYSLGIAKRLYGQKTIWIETKKQMEESLYNAFDKNGRINAIYGPKYRKENYKKLFSKMFTVGNFNPDIDASLFSLVWPAGIKNGKIAENILSQIINKLDKDGSIMRYVGDSYDGIMIEGSSLRKGGNSWPLLNFWAAICFNRIGLRGKALKYYEWVLKKTDSYLPEQIDFKGNFKGTCPLSWAHAMFVIASKELGFIK